MKKLLKYTLLILATITFAIACKKSEDEGKKDPDIVDVWAFESVMATSVTCVDSFDLGEEILAGVDLETILLGISDMIHGNVIFTSDKKAIFINTSTNSKVECTYTHVNNYLEISSGNYSIQGGCEITEENLTWDYDVSHLIEMAKMLDLTEFSDEWETVDLAKHGITGAVIRCTFNRQ